MKKIYNLQIDTSDMPTEETVRSFTVSGDVDSEFIICVVQNDTIKYYDWVDKSFELGHNDKNNNLKITLSSDTYNSIITFPSGGGDYTIKLIVSPGTETQGSNKYIISRSITKEASSPVVTFTAATANTANYATFPTTTSTGGTTSVDNFDFNWDIVNASTDAGGFGLRLIDIAGISDSYWYFTTTDTVDVYRPKTDTVDGATSSSTAVTLDTSYKTTGITAEDFVYGTGVTNGTKVAAVSGEDDKDITLSAAMSISDGVTLSFVTPSDIVVVDDVTDIVVGMIISGVSSGSLVGLPTILSIDTETKTLTLNINQAFADGITLTFKAIGSAVIKTAIGLDVEFTQYPTVTPTVLTQNVRANVSASTTVTLSDTLGIAGGNLISYSGVGVNNASTNLITSVTPDPGGGDSDGLMVVQLAQTLTAGTVLTFNDVFKTINFNGNIVINSYPDANRTIYLDLDKLITVGAAS